LMHLLFSHLDVCKDVCDHFGITTTLTPHKQKKDNKITGFTVKSFRDPTSVANDEKEYQFSYDPMWDDGTDFEGLYDGIDDEDMVPDKYPAIQTLVPDSDDEIIELTKKWVNAVVSDMVCCVTGFLVIALFARCIIERSFLTRTLWICVRTFQK
jgi:predicted heme/steroid binding protein